MSRASEPAVHAFNPRTFLWIIVCTGAYLLNAGVCVFMAIAGELLLGVVFATGAVAWFVAFVRAARRIVQREGNRP